MPWEFCEIVKSHQTVKCASCGGPIAADEHKVRINPSKKQDGRSFHYYHRTCFAALLGPMMEKLLRGVSWRD
jgi:hypothetical protein